MTAGAVSAALRELRPVEIVGLYEDVLEGFQVPCPTILPVYVTGTHAHAHSAEDYQGIAQD